MARLAFHRPGRNKSFRDRGRRSLVHDGQAQIAGPGAIIYFAAHATTFLRNAGDTPATYYVIYYTTPLTPKR